MIKSKPKLIFYLDRQKLTLAGTNIDAPVTLDFPDNTVSDIEVTDVDLLNSILVKFFKLNKISPSDALLVLSPETYFDKSLNLSVDPTEKQKQIDNFLENLPFKNLYVKDYLLNNQGRLVAVNKKFYEPIVKSLRDNGFTVISILPQFILDHLQIKLTDYLPKEVKTAYAKRKFFDDFSLLPVQDIQKISTVQIIKPKEDQTRTIILVAVFALLLIVLLVLKLFLPKFIKPKPKTSKSPSPTVVSVKPTPTSTPTINYKSPETISIKVINSSGLPNQAAKIKQSLTKSNFKEIITESAAIVTAAKNQISFSPQVSPESREKIKQAVIQLAGESAEIESTDLIGIDALVTLVSSASAKPTP